jgi:hypothetical protein
MAGEGIQLYSRPVLALDSMKQKETYRDCTHCRSKRETRNNLRGRGKCDVVVDSGLNGAELGCALTSRFPFCRPT